jgi:hypothetical protein
VAIKQYNDDSISESSDSNEEPWHYVSPGKVQFEDVVTIVDIPHFSFYDRSGRTARL